MDVGLRSHHPQSYQKCKSVSILVLMDVGLRLIAHKQAAQTNISFNPCFNGCRSAIGLIDGIKVRSDEVSILVLMDVGLRC